MKIAQIGDIHLSDSRVKEFEVLIKQLADKIVEREPDLIVFTGDMFIHRDKLTPKQVELARMFFKTYLKDYQILIITGNHDISMSTTKTDSLSAIFSSDDQKVYTEIGSYKDINDYRFHFFPYPSKKEMTRLCVDDISDISDEKIFKLFTIDDSKKNVLVYHGTLSDFDITETYQASESAINIGKDLIIPKSFWGQFDATMAGHLHKYQGIDKAIYTGVHFPLTFADSDITGFVIWDNLNPEFVVLDQLYPYITIDLGKLHASPTGLTEEAIRKVEANDCESCKGARVRIKYKISSNLSGNVDHTKISDKFIDAKEIKIVPEYIQEDPRSDNCHNNKVSFEDFQEHNILEIISTYIDENKYHPEVKNIAKKIEEEIKEKYANEDTSGIHFSLDKLRIENFKCFGKNNPEIEFNKLDKVVGIFGRNKIGKSSLVESISWVLFGTTTRNKDVNSVIRNGEDYTKVEIEFNSNNIKYKIIRKRTLKSSSLLFYMYDGKDWLDISGATIVVTQKNIENIIGTFDMFISTIYSPQNNIDLLVNKKPSERKKIILDCLQIDVLTKRQVEIQNIKHIIKDRIAYKKGELSTYTNQLTNLISQNPSERLKTFEEMLKGEVREQKRLQTHLLTYTKKVYEYESLLEEQDRITNEINEIRKNIDTITKRVNVKREEIRSLENIIADRTIVDDGIARIMEIEREIKAMEEELTIVVNKRKELAEIKNRELNLNKNYKESIKLLTANRDSVVDSMSNLKTLNCPEPKCPLNEKILKSLDSKRINLDELDKQIEEKEQLYKHDLNEIIIRKKELEYDIENSTYKHTKLSGLKFQLKAEEDKEWGSLKAKMESGEDFIGQVTELVAVYKNQLEKLRQERDEKIQKRGEIAKKIATIDSYNKEIKKIELDLNLIDQNVRNYSDQINNCKRDLKDIEKAQSKIGEIQDRVTNLKEYFGHCNKYNEIVGKYGVLFSIVDKSLPIIEGFAQEILSETTNGMISITIDSFKTLSKGNKVDEVVINISDAKGRRDVREASGAELVLVSLALRASLSYLLSLRMGSKVELFIIDEGFGAFDDENLIGVKDLMKRLGEKFNKILFITHVSELKDVAQSVIKVHGDSRKSTYELLKGSQKYE